MVEIDVASNEYDDDWIRAARLTREAGGEGKVAEVARAKLRVMEETEMVPLEGGG